jgi:hypothetical protein
MRFPLAVEPTAPRLAEFSRSYFARTLIVLARRTPQSIRILRVTFCIGLAEFRQAKTFGGRVSSIVRDHMAKSPSRASEYFYNIGLTLQSLRISSRCIAFRDRLRGAHKHDVHSGIE